MIDDPIPLEQRIGRILDDPAIKDEVLKKLEPTLRRFGFGPKDVSAARNAVANFDPNRPIREVTQREAIVLKIGRPVLFVEKDHITFPEEFKDDESGVWRKRLEQASPSIGPKLLSVGRINVKNHESMNWIGTGWLVRPDIIVTNAHVADEFATKTDRGTGYAFRKNFRGRMMLTSIDFREEYGNDEHDEFTIGDVLYIGERAFDGHYNPDVALLKLNVPTDRAPAEPIPLSDRLPEPGTAVAVIGYPAFDSRIPDAALMRRVFGDDYDLKRLAPGTIRRVEDAFHALEHDASTLGGNSGSAILDLERGEAVGLHFAGSFHYANYAVPARIIRELVGRFAS
jgi:endonuclease G